MAGGGGGVLKPVNNSSSVQTVNNLFVTGNIGATGGSSIISCNSLTSSGTVNLGNRLLGTANPADNFWIGLQGSGADEQRVGIGLSGNSSATGAVTGVTFNSNGNQVVIDSGGNFGIGTASPWTKLDVRGQIGVYNFYQNGGTHPETTSSRIYLATTAGWGTSIQTRVLPNATLNQSDLQFLTPDNGGGQVARMTILGSSNSYGGFVGIGTGSPNSTLHVYNTINDATYGLLCIENNQTFGYNTGSGIGTSLSFKSQWAGDGIAPTVVLGKMDVLKEASANYGDSYMAFSTRYTANRVNGGVGTLSEKMRITGSGSVGIGTNSPGNTLHVKGNPAPLLLQRSITTNYWKLGPDASDAFVVYNGNDTGVFVPYGGTAWSANSDKRLKKNIEYVTNALDKIDQLQPIKYNWLTESDDSQKTYGVFAQDVEKIAPEIVTKSETEQYPDGILSVKYTELIPILIKGIQELREEVTNLKAEIQVLKNN